MSAFSDWLLDRDVSRPPVDAKMNDALASKFGDRVNLSVQGDVQTFMARLSQLQDADEVSRFFNSEMDEMRCKRPPRPNQYGRNDLYKHPSLNTVKAHVSRRKKAAEEMLGAMDMDTQLADVFKLPGELYHQLNKNYDRKIKRRQDNHIHIADGAGYIQELRKMIRSNNRIEILTGLCGLTGRRPYELAALDETVFAPIVTGTGSGTTQKEKYFALYDGFVQKNEKPQHPIVIPLLAPFDEIEQAFDRLRNDTSIAPGSFLGMEAPEFNQKSAMALKRLRDARIKPYWPNNTYILKLCTADGIRGLYAEFCDYAFNNNGKGKGIDTNDYIPAILGAYISEEHGHRGATLRFDIEGIKPKFIKQPDNPLTQMAKNEKPTEKAPAPKQKSKPVAPPSAAEQKNQTQNNQYQDLMQWAGQYIEQFQQDFGLEDSGILEEINGAGRKVDPALLQTALDYVQEAQAEFSLQDDGIAQELQQFIENQNQPKQKKSKTPKP